MRAALFLLLLGVAPTILAAEPKAFLGLPYAGSADQRQSLDLYAPAEGADHPVVVWVHGGGWTRGDKASVGRKPQAFANKGEERYREVSPAEFVAAGKDLPAFLILHVASRGVSTVQSQIFAEKLKAAGGRVRVLAAEGKNHRTINAEIGLENDEPTEAIFRFLEVVTTPQAPR